MTWAALSDDLIARMQHDELSRDDQLMYVEGLVYAARLLTDGELPSDLRAFTTHPQAAEAALRLLSLDYWRVSAKGYEITNYLKVNRSAEQVEKSKERNRVRQHRARLHREGDHSMCVPSYCSHAPNAVTNAVTNGVSHDALSSPLLSSREEKEKEKASEPARGAQGAATASPNWQEQLSPMHRFGEPEFDAEDDESGYWWQITEHDFDIAASISTEYDIEQIAFTLDGTDFSGLPTTLDETVTEAPHLEPVISNVSPKDDGLLIIFSGHLNNRTNQIADYCERLLKRHRETS